MINLDKHAYVSMGVVSRDTRIRIPHCYAPQVEVRVRIKHEANPLMGVPINSHKRPGVRVMYETKA